MQKWEDVICEIVLGWRSPLRLQYELADSFEEFGRKIQQTTLVGVERVVAPGKLSFDLVDELWYVAVVALLKELLEGEEDLSFRFLDGDSRV